MKAAMLGFEANVIYQDLSPYSPYVASRGTYRSLPGSGFNLAVFRVYPYCM